MVDLFFNMIKFTNSLTLFKVTTYPFENTTILTDVSTLSTVMNGSKRSTESSQGKFTNEKKIIKTIILNVYFLH